MKPYVSIDLETTGLDPSLCQILEIGAVIDDWVTPLDQLSRFHCYIVHEQIVGDPIGLSMNAGLLRTIGDRKNPGLYLEPREVGAHFAHFVAAKLGVKGLVGAGKNFASFDLQFLKRLPNFSQRVNFHHRSIDPAMFYWKPSEDDVPPSTTVCMERACVPGEVAHSAVDDAIVVVKLIRSAFLGQRFDEAG